MVKQNSSNKINSMKKFLLIFPWCALLALALMLIFSVTGCRTSKRSKSHVSVTVTTKDSTGKVVKVDSFWRDRQVHDTAVGVPGAHITTTVLHDTIIKKGSTTLIVRGNTVDCYTDSLTLVIANLVREKERVSHQRDSLAFFNLLHTDSTLKEVTERERAGWLSALWAGVKNILAVAGAVWLVLLMIRFIVKRNTIQA
jgi:hypothetical protein